MSKYTVNYLNIKEVAQRLGITENQCRLSYCETSKSYRPHFPKPARRISIYSFWKEKAIEDFERLLKRDPKMMWTKKRFELEEQKEKRKAEKKRKKERVQLIDKLFSPKKKTKAFAYGV